MLVNESCLSMLPLPLEKGEGSKVERSVFLRVEDRRVTFLPTAKSWFSLRTAQ